MPVKTEAERFTLIETDRDVQQKTFAQDVEAGLADHPKRLPYRYLYDARGSELFEAICELPEYYLTRCEREIHEHVKYHVDKAKSIKLTKKMTTQVTKKIMMTTKVTKIRNMTNTSHKNTKTVTGKIILGISANICKTQPDQSGSGVFTRGPALRATRIRASGSGSFLARSRSSATPR